MENSIFGAYGSFLRGETWSNARRFHDISLSKTVIPTAYLLEICTGKKVLHTGCLGHAGNS
jgi:hypothetical protein